MKQCGCRYALHVAMGSVPATSINSTDAIYCKIIWLVIQ